MGELLNRALGKLIAGKFVDDEKLRKKLLVNYPKRLSSFSARIDVALALGLLAEFEWNALDRIRDLLWSTRSGRRKPPRP